MLVFALVVAPARLLAQDEASVSGYHDAAALRQRLRALAAARPDVVSLFEIGRSAEGRAIEAILLSDSSGPKAEDKPALVVLGNLAGDEAAGGEAVLRIADFVVSAVEREPAFRALVLKRSVWLIPRPNPDATERLFMTPAISLREALERHDDDGDGELDEDGPEDLNGDGRVTQMRVADDDGLWLPDEGAPGLMRLARKSKGERGRYRLLEEGLDKDRDGKVNEDGPGGTDLNQNFPIEYLDRGSSPRAGVHALSAPESRALAEFLVSHRNIGLVIHTHCNAHGALSSGLQSVPAADQESYELLRRLYKDSDRREDGTPKPDPIDPFATPGGARAHGSFQDFAYHGLGILSWPARLWQEAPGSWERPEDRDESAELKRARAWQRFFKDKGGLDEWRAVVHPEFGAVELGGLRPFTLSTPPGPYLNEAVAPLVRFALNAATLLPELELRLEGLRVLDPKLTEIRVSLRNRGRFAAPSARAVELRRPTPLVLDCSSPAGTRLIFGLAREAFPRLGAGEAIERRFTIAGPRKGVLRLELSSPKAGRCSLSIDLEKGL